MLSELVSIKKIKPNPNNPRLIKDDKFKKLVQSIIDFPEMLSIRPIVVNHQMMVLGGNMRLKACQEAGITEVPVIIANGLTEEQQREFIIKDNISGGEWDWDILANEWDVESLGEWGLDIPKAEEEENEEEADDLGIFPLSITLNSFEYKKFQTYKKENGLKSDTQAFKELWAAKNQVDEQS